MPDHIAIILEAMLDDAPLVEWALMLDVATPTC